MRIRDYIQINPFRGMGVATSDSSTTLSSNNSRMKAYAAIGKSVSFPMDMDIVFGAKADRTCPRWVFLLTVCAMACSGS